MQSTVQSRHNMVDGQLEPNRVLQAPIIAAMGSVMREHYVPESYKQSAYLDEHIPIGAKRYLLSPTVFGHLLQQMDIHSGQKVLIIGAGLGYSAAVLHAMGCEVFALEESQDLASKSRQILSSNGLSSIQVQTSSFTMGWPTAAPFDRILLEGGAESIPEKLIEQLASDGLMAYVGVQAKLPIRHVGQGFVATLRKQGELKVEKTYDGVNAPILPGMEAKSGFNFA